MNKQTVAENNVDLRSLVTTFVTQLTSAVEAHANQRVQAALWSALSAGGTTIALPRRRGRPRKNPTVLFSSPIAVSPLQRRRPKQLCPVPGCANVAAPVFGMVCAEHKGVSKSRIRKYRAARRDAKAAPKAKGRARSAKSATKSATRSAKAA